jgi:hypothetical protein
MHAHKSRLCGPRKMHEHRSCKVLKHASFPFKSTEGSARPRYTSRDPESAESPSEGRAGSKCAGGGSARPECPSTEPVRAKCHCDFTHDIRSAGGARLWLSGVGGSGKSALAFQMARAASEKQAARKEIGCSTADFRTLVIDVCLRRRGVCPGVSQRFKPRPFLGDRPQQIEKIACRPRQSIETVQWLMSGDEEIE